ncbi:MAG: hypothetical protein HY554_05775 [Elusimicrobia bacterium]|nr:hypothetical protein [Elusimicrobiota bacterium]
MRAILATIAATWAAAATLAAAPLAADARPAGSTFVSGRVSRSLAGSYEVYDPFLGVSQRVHWSANGASVSGFPLSGSLSRTGSFIRFFGLGLDADVREWAGGYHVTATVYPRDPRQPHRRLWFAMSALGRTDDPANPPSFSVFDTGASLTLRPSGKDYSISGWVDSSFGPEGVALVGLIATAASEKLPQAPQPGGAAPAPAPARRYHPIRVPVAAPRWH